MTRGKFVYIIKYKKKGDDKMEKTCPVCGNTFEAKKSNHVCCCRRCRDRYTRTHKVRNCIICGKEFSSPNNT